MIRESLTASLTKARGELTVNGETFSGNDASVTYDPNILYPFIEEKAKIPLYWQGATGSSTGSMLLKILPYSTGIVGQKFKTLVMGYMRYPFENNKAIWVPTPLVELDCTTGEIHGPLESTSFMSNERLCSELSVRSGSLGDQGEVNAPCAVVNLRSCPRFAIYFANDENITANALIARA